MDWSERTTFGFYKISLKVTGLCNPYAEHPFLRDVLGYKRPWVYYLAMILDPILRLNWIFYAIYANELQHSALLSFFVGFSEVCRRGMWTLFRVENEHCTNVGRFRASRDVPLPYDIIPPSPSSPQDTNIIEPQAPAPEDHPHRSATWNDPIGENAGIATSSNLEAQPSSGSLRRRATLSSTPIQRGIARVGTMMNQAHVQDFERKRRPVAPEPASPYQGARTAEEEDEDEDEDDEESSDEEGMAEDGVEGGGEDGAEEEDEGGVGRQIEEDVQGAQEILRRHRSAVDQ